jgi:hypothetical protein
VKSWFDLAGRVVSLTAQLAARTTELRDAHKQVAYWKQIAGERWDQIARLNADVNEARADATRGRNLIPAIAPSVLGSRDRANALRREGENEQLRTENEELRRDNARLAVLVDECNTKHGEGNPS